MAWKGSSCGSARGEARIDMRHQIEADEVEQAEHAGLRNAHRLADDGVGLLDVEAGANASVTAVCSQKTPSRLAMKPGRSLQ